MQCPLWRSESVEWTMQSNYTVIVLPKPSWVSTQLIPQETVWTVVQQPCKELLQTWNVATTSWGLNSCLWCDVHTIIQQMHTVTKVSFHYAIIGWLTWELEYYSNCTFEAKTWCEWNMYNLILRWEFTETTLTTQTILTKLLYSLLGLIPKSV